MLSPVCSSNIKEEKMRITEFNQMNLSPAILGAVQKKGYQTCTPVQSKSIPPLMEYKDLIAKAPTGTGKTLAFGIPIIEHIDTQNEQIQALILAPTRELAIQICTELKDLAKFKQGVRSLCIYGGQSFDRQLMLLKKHPQIIVATPGRLNDHLNRRTIRLTGVQTVVLDEADRMLDMGFYKEVTSILDLMPGRRNLALLSATISHEVMTIGWMYQRDPVEVTVLEDTGNKPDIRQYSLKASESEKTGLLSCIINAEGYKRTLVFCNTKRKVERVSKSLKSKGFAVDCIHGDIKQNIREKVLQTFRKGALDILVATDVAARGIDVEGIDTVFNYDIPEENEYYIHRIGRTGRAKSHGASYTFVSSYADMARLKDIIKYTKSQINQIPAESIAQKLPGKVLGL